MKTRFRLTKREIMLAVAFAALGFVFSIPQWIQFMSMLNPIFGFLIYEGITIVALYAISKVGLVVHNIEIKKPLQIIGIFCLTTAWFIIVNWTSPYVQYTVTGKLEGAAANFYQSEDGAAWFFWYNVVGMQWIDITRLYAFVFTPFVLAIIGGILIDTTRQKIDKSDIEL